MAYWMIFITGSAEKIHIKPDQERTAFTSKSSRKEEEGKFNNRKLFSYGIKLIVYLILRRIISSIISAIYGQSVSKDSAFQLFTVMR